MLVLYRERIGFVRQSRMADYGSRVKCATLALHAARTAMRNGGGKATTE
jgi:NifU-like protein involved in Fe-S cluster formation